MTTTRLEALMPVITLERETRTIRGKIAAQGVPTNDYRRIVLHPGALRPRTPLNRVKMLVDHDQRQPVGFMTELNPKTLEAAFKVPEGEAGDKALADAEKGLRDGLSIGFYVPDEDGAASYDAETHTFNVYAAELMEVSLCAIPAFQDAGVTNVAASHHTAPPTAKESTTVDPETLTLEQIEQTLAQSVEDIDRRVETRLAAFTPPPSGDSGPAYQSFGAFVQELASGSTEARAFYERLAVDGTTADDYKRNAWVADVIHLVEKNRRILSIFNTEPLPEKGMTLEYARLKSNTTKAGKQAVEGDALLKGKVELESATTDIDTYGGASEVSIQTVKRANAAYLTTLFKAMGIAYAKETEGAVRTTVLDTIAAQALANASLTLPAAATTYDWLDMLVDASEMYDDLGFNLEGTLVSKDVFKRLIRLEDTNGNSLMRVTGEGVNRVGSIDVKGLKGDVASVEFHLFPGAPANTASFFDPLAVTTWESPGAPFQLQSEEVLNLTEAFALYGFLASAAQFPTALVPIEFAV